MSWRAIPTTLAREPDWLRLTGDARSLYITLRLILGKPALGLVFRPMLDALTPNARTALGELAAGGIVTEEGLPTGESMIWLRRWALDDDPSLRGAKNATGLLRAVADLPPCSTLAQWYDHHRPVLETSGDWPAVADSLSDSLSDRGSLARGRDGDGDGEREAHKPISLSGSPNGTGSRASDGAPSFGAPDARASESPGATVTGSPDDPEATAGADGAGGGADSPVGGDLAQTLAAKGIAVPRSRLAPPGPATDMTREEQAAWVRRMSGREATTQGEAA